MITVHIPWSSKTNKLTLWNDVCADIVEHFGLPGDRYTTKVNEDYMDFNFHNDHDGLMCKILVSDYT